MKKILIVLILILFVTGCASKEKENNVDKIHESVVLPYTLRDEETEFKNSNGEKYSSDWKWQSLKLKEIDLEENTRFLKKIDNPGIIDLNEEWVILELDFGNGIIMSPFDSPEIDYKEPKIIVGNDVIYQIMYGNYYKEGQENIMSDKEIIGVSFDSEKYQYLIPKKIITKGMQLRLNTNQYIDIDNGNF